jgi:hypothetical protein
MKLRVIGATGGGALIAALLLLAPALAAPGSSQARRHRAPDYHVDFGDSFTPAVSDPRLAAALARRGMTFGDLRFTPASIQPDRNRHMRVALRSHTAAPTDAVRTPVSATSAPPQMASTAAITPSNYNLGVSVGWRRFSIAGDVTESENGVVPGRREAAQIGMSYRANRRLTGRVTVAAERNEGTQRIIAPDEAYSLDAGAAFSITRHIDLTAGARYRIARDRIAPLGRDERQDSQAVYIGTAFRF